MKTVRIAELQIHAQSHSVIQRLTMRRAGLDAVREWVRNSSDGIGLGAVCHNPDGAARIRRIADVPAERNCRKIGTPSGMSIVPHVL